MPYPAFPGSNATTSTWILLSFSQSLIIHDSRAEEQRFMVPKFLKQLKIHDSYMFCKYDSWCMIPLNPRHQGLSSSGPLSEVGLSLREVSSTLILSDENMANK